MIVKVNELKKKFGEKYVLNDVSFEINSGEIFALIGPNGAGKTTTLKCLYGELTGNGGSIELFDSTPNTKTKQRIAVMTEDRKEFNNFTGFDYLNLYSTLYTKWNDKVFSNFALHYNFDMDQKIQNYSIGTKTIFFLALTIATGADLIILDEPTQHLDPVVRSEVLNILKKFVMEEGKTILISSHEIYELEEIASSIAIINEGKVLYTNSVEKAKSEHNVIIRGDLINGEVIGLINENTLVKTGNKYGRTPTLNEIVIGYLRKNSNFSPFV